MQLFCFVLIFSFGVNNTIQASDQNLDSLLTVANAIENDSNRLKAFFDIAQNYRTINADTAIYLLKDIIEKSSDGKFSNMYYNATLLLSNAYQNIGNYTEAINLVLELLKLYEKEGDIDKQTKCLLDLGELCRASQQFDAGIAYLNQVIRITKKTKNLKLLCFAYNRLSAIYYEYPNPELTLAYIDSAISKCEEISYIELMPTNLDILGAAYSMQKDYARAIPTYFKSIEINNSFGEDEEDNINTYINLARAYYYTEKYDSALIFAQKAFSFANESNIPIYEENSAFLLSLIYSATDDYKNAFNFLNSTMNIRNFLFNKEKNSQISELNKKFETEKKEKEIKNQKLIIRNKEIYNSFLIVSIFFLLALILGILFFVVNTKKKNKLLEDKNAEIAAQRDELQYFADELEKANKQKDRFFSIIA
ncbi:MAG: tetratricopeptide repeat protein, partial [Bacteroidota bacterium]|nr:tetratricopeptide repeat protein [Bacteroidota bacterium]